MKIHNFTLPLAVIFLGVSALLNAGELKTYKACFHIHSNFSSKGRLSVSGIADKIKSNKIDIAILADDAIKKWEWGAPPWRNLVKKTVSLTSVFDANIEAYVNEVKAVNAKNPDTLIIPGLEVTPHYYWRGNPLQEEWEVVNANKHMVVLGFPNLSGWREIPAIHNKNAAKYTYLSIIYLWPHLLIIISLGYILSNKKSLKITAYALLLFSILFAVDFYPYKDKGFNQYDSSLGEKPYQRLIDYTNQKNGLIFWAHPESRVWEDKKIFGKLSIVTNPYHNSLKNTYGSTGFGYFQEGSTMAGRPGGIWDEVLAGYCGGLRAQPLWAVGELDFAGSDKDDTYIRSVDNIIFAEELSEPAVLGAINEGNFYIRKNKYSDIYVSGIKVSDGNSTCGLGGYIYSNSGSNVYYQAYITDKNKKSGGVEAILVKNGSVAHRQKIKIPALFKYASRAPDLLKMDYYRLEVAAEDGSHIVLNPIFVVSR